MTKRQELYQILLKHPDGIKKSEIDKLCDSWYYCNAGHYTSQLLKTMVGRGEAIRIRKGFYKAGKGQGALVKNVVSENQQSLFEN